MYTSAYYPYIYLFITYLLYICYSNIVDASRIRIKKWIFYHFGTLKFSAP